MIDRLITCLCLAWLLVYPLLYGSETGKRWIVDTVEEYVTTDGDAKECAILVLLALPVLVAGTVCAFSRAVRHAGFCSRCAPIPTLVQKFPPTASLRIRAFSRWKFYNGSSPMDYYALLFIATPAAVFVLASLHRHISSAVGSYGDGHRDSSGSHENYGTNETYYQENYDSNRQNYHGNQDTILLRRIMALMTHKIANTFGSVAMIAFSFFLVPVSRHGPILKLLGWNPSKAVRLHIWCGRIIVWGSLLHGLMHASRWYYYGRHQVVVDAHGTITVDVDVDSRSHARQHLAQMVIPPRQCWEHIHHPHKSLELNGCSDEPDSDAACTCTMVLKNFFGMTAVLALVTLSLFAVPYVRRKCYTVFYTSHVLAAPIVMISVILHYDRAVTYMTPSLLYYMATWLPHRIEQQRLERLGGVRILSIERIADPTPVGGNSSRSRCGKNKHQKCCFAITFQASSSARYGANDYQPGTYVKLKVPQISHLSHPFSVNTVLPQSPCTNTDNGSEQQHKLRIIFRVFGNFTNQLAELSNTSIPIMYTDGFHTGVPDMAPTCYRLHDTVLCIAGGIGITPYLTFLYQLSHLLLSSNKDNDCSRDVDHGYKTRKIVLHWMCRDVSLVNYVKREYFDPLQQLIEASSSSSRHFLEVRIMLHSTATVFSMQSAQRKPASYSLLSNPGDDDDDYDDPVLYEFDAAWPTVVSGRLGVPVQHKDTPFLTFAAILWFNFFLLWTIRTRGSAESDQGHVHSYLHRLWLPVGMVVNSILISWIGSNVSRWLSCTNSTFTPSSEHVMQQETSSLMKQPTTYRACTRSHDNTKTMANRMTSLTSFASGDASSDGESTPLSFDDTESCSAAATFSIEQRGGRRPAVHELLECLSGSTSPGVFCCGPTELIEEIRSEARRKAKSYHLDGVAIYDEAFTM